MEAKKIQLTLLGSSQTGKTSLTNCFVSGTKINDTYTPTIGVDFVSKILYLNSEQIRLQIWDTAGQEKFLPLIPSYIKGAGAVMLVFDITNRTTFEDIQNKWIYMVREQESVDGFKIYLIGNKIDLSSERQVEIDEAREYSDNQNIKYFESSCQQVDEIEQLFLEITQDINSS